MSRMLPIVTGVAIALLSAVTAQAATLKLISHAYNSQTTPVNAYDPQISADGYTVAFSSTASDFVAPGVDGFFGADAFVYNVPCHSAEIVSVAWNGAAANGPSGGSLGQRVSLSGDGRYVAFTSSATNLVFNDNDTNGYADVFLVDRSQPIGSQSRVRRISAAPNGGGNGSSSQPMISANGQYVVFHSDASNLVAGDTNGTTDIFVYSIASQALALVTHDSNGGPTAGYSDYAGINADGSRVIFRSGASDLIVPAPNGYPHAYVAGPIGNALIDRNAAMEVSSEGVLPELAISGNSIATAFVSQSPNLWASMAAPPQVFVRRPINNVDTLLLITLNPSGGPGPISSRAPSLDGTGQYLAFQSSKPNWTPGDPWNGVYRLDLVNNILLLLSPGLNGQPENGASTAPAISGNGRRVAFRSSSSNLIAGVNGGGVYLASDGSWPRRCDSTARQ